MAAFRKTTRSLDERDTVRKSTPSVSWIASRVSVQESRLQGGFLAGQERLLAGVPCAIIYAAAPSGAGWAEKRQIVELLVFEKTPAARVAGSSEATALTGNAGPGKVQGIDTAPEWIAALEHPAKEVRLEALRRWAEQGAATPLDPITHALVDPDESVRARAQELVKRAWAAKAEAKQRN